MPEFAGQALQEHLEKLHRTWHDDTRLSSNLTAVAAHPALQEIMDMGECSLPYIFDDMVATGQGFLWVPALYQMIGHAVEVPDNPTSQDHVDAWIKWGQEQGYLQQSM